MAKQISSDIDYKRGDTLHVWPQDVVVVPEENGRTFGLDPARIIELAHKIVKEGQRVPAIARRIEGNKLKLTAGNYRHAAITYINEHKLTEQPMRFRIEVVDQNAEEAFKTNIIENRDRNKTTAIDDAHNIRKLSEQFSWSDEQILEFYGVSGKPKSQAWLDQMRKLLTLSKEQQKLIHDGELSANVGFRLADMPEEDRKEMLELAKEGGKVTETSILRAARKAGKVTTSVSLKMPEVKTAFKYIAEEDTKATPNMKKFADAFLKFTAGELPEPDFRKLMRRLLGE